MGNLKPVSSSSFWYLFYTDLAFENTDRVICSEQLVDVSCGLESGSMDSLVIVL